MDHETELFRLPGLPSSAALALTDSVVVLRVDRTDPTKAIIKGYRSTVADIAAFGGGGGGAVASVNGQTGVVVLAASDVGALANTGKLAFPAATVKKAQALTDGATISTDAALADVGTVTIAGNRTMAKPTNLTDQQILQYNIKQDATGSRTITWNAAFSATDSVAIPTLSTTAARTDVLTFQYDSAADKLYILGYNLGRA